ncbi:MAG: universal stress protein [Thiohalomonadales bacterium]
MIGYKKILVAVDLTESASTVINKALQVIANDLDYLEILHVIDYLPYMGFGEGALINPSYEIPTEEIMGNARTSLEKVLANKSIKNYNLSIEIGNAASEIVRYADEHTADLIVMGSHGRHGVKLLLGSCANAVLHHAHCDVLAVRITDG